MVLIVQYGLSVLAIIWSCLFFSIISNIRLVDNERELTVVKPIVLPRSNEEIPLIEVH